VEVSRDVLSLHNAFQRFPEVPAALLLFPPWNESHQEGTWLPVFWAIGAGYLYRPIWCYTPPDAGSMSLPVAPLLFNDGGDPSLSTI